MVHGDANENNIIVDEATGRAAALIDWCVCAGALWAAMQPCACTGVHWRACCSQHLPWLLPVRARRSDVLHTWLVAEVAIAGAYVMLMALTQTGSSDEALAAVAHVLVSAA